MSGHAAEEAARAAPGHGIATIIVPRSRDLGGFEVRRVLPSAHRRMVGPFVFLDQMGPVAFAPGHGIDVRPHPHIGLATLTYLFAGEILHRDSLGSVQPIRPGAANWMTAGRGIVHSERSPPEARRAGAPLFGMQSWIALPLAHEETDPAFVHHRSETLPLVAGEGKEVRLIAGTLYGATAPARTFSPLFYAEARLAAGARLPVPAEHEERALYLVEGVVEIDGEGYAPGQLLVLEPGAEITVSAPADAPAAARLLLLGGAPLEGPRHIWWNFVSSSAERIEAAKADWKAGRFAPVPDEPDFIPLPE